MYLDIALMEYTSRLWRCHTPHPACLSQMEKLESIQYSAASAVTNAWKGTSREKLHDELGWESLNLRRWSRRPTLLYKIINYLTPDYTRHPIPPIRDISYNFRRFNIIGQIFARSESFKIKFLSKLPIRMGKA